MENERDLIASAIVAAADREYSPFKDSIQKAIEKRFKERIAELAKEKAETLFREPEDFQAEPVADLTPDDVPVQLPQDTTGNPTE